MVIFLSFVGREPVDIDKSLKPATHGQRDSRPTVTFPAARHHCPLSRTKLDSHRIIVPDGGGAGVYEQGSHRPQTPPPVLPPGKLLQAPEKKSRASVDLQLVLLRTVYSQAQGCVCAALQLGGDVEQHWLMSKYDVIHKTGST